MAHMNTWVDLSEVQGNVVRSYGPGARAARYVFLKAPKLTPDSRRVLRRWLTEVTFGDPRLPNVACSSGGPCESPRDVRDDHAAFVNISFTFKGLVALDIPALELEGLPCDFRKGAAARAPQLKDHWHERRDVIPLDDAHVMLSVHSRCAEDVQHRWRELQEVNEQLRSPFELVHALDAGFSQDGREREGFGFADGLSQPAVEGVDTDAVGDGVYAGAHPPGPALRRQASLMLEDLGLRALSRKWRLIRTGEFLLGYENEDGRLPQGSNTSLGPHSTYMVYREIDQDVEAFDIYVEKSAARLGLTQDELRAKIVGRWQNGTPAIRRRPDPPEVAAVRQRLNDFRYGNDPNGYACPLGAHARRANPRDALPGGAEQTMRHRIIRRGMPYHQGGDELRPERQGLAFVCFNASIENGFEFIQGNWINDGQAFGLESQRDFMAQDWEGGGRPTKMVIQGFRPTILEPPSEPFVKVRGCEYLLVPSRRACTWLAGVLAEP
jgi:deferrochelatase/peroxidase EfeB